MYNEKKENPQISHQILSAKSVQKLSPSSKINHLKLSGFTSSQFIGNKSDTNSPSCESFRNEKLFSLLSNDEELNEIKCHFISNVLIIKEYEGWINLMLQMLNIKQENINHIDIATPIQKGLEKLQNLENENFILKKKLICEIKKNRDKADYVNELKSDLKNINKEQEHTKLEVLNFEHEKLLETAHSISEELDDLSEKNKKMMQQVSKRNSDSQISSLYSELEKLKEESKILKKIEKFQKEKKEKNEEHFHVFNSTQSNVRNSIPNEQDNMIKNVKTVNMNRNNGYDLVSSDNRNSLGSIFCFP